LVSKVLTGTPAESAGVRVGDLIVALGGDEISGVTDLRRALARHQGETFDLDVIRDGSPTRLSVTLPAPEEDRPSGPRAGLAIKVPSVHLVPRAPRVRVTTRPPVRLLPPAPTPPENEPRPPAPPRPARPARARADQVV
jgi:membrane-associated protease RseP (regulator of RpoE activity)